MPVYIACGETHERQTPDDNGLLVLQCFLADTTDDSSTPHVSDPTFVPVIALTGGIGSGKTSVARWLAKQRKVAMIDGDEAGHKVLTFPSVKEQIRKRLQDTVFDERGEVVRASLARRVFGSSPRHREARAVLEAIVHPEIQKILKGQILAARHLAVEAVILDAAVLLEAGWAELCDTVVFIDTPRRQRLRRIAENRRWTEAELTARETSQWAVDAKRRAADYVVDNSGTLNEAGIALERIVVHIMNSHR